MIKAILFDFNGVIIDDEPLQLQSYQEVLRPEGIELTEKDYYSSLGTNDVRFLETAFARAGKTLTPDARERLLIEKTRAHRALIADEIPFFAGAVNFIKEVRHHFALGVVSMARGADISHVLERAEILDAFSVIVSADEVRECKPNPECYNLGFKQIDHVLNKKGEYPLVREEVLVIEDAPPGVQAGKAAGLWVLGVANTVAPDELRRAGADSVTKTLADWTPETVELVFR